MAKKFDIYSGHGNQDVVISNYMNGIYFNNKTHSKELIGNKVNKYNKQMIQRTSDLNVQFRALIIVYGITIKLIQEHKDHTYGDSKNLWRLMQAQSGTIRFNKLLRSALRRYAVDKQLVYDRLKKDLDSQLDRITRNQQLILDTFKNYGMNNLAEIVAQDTGMNIFEHAAKFTDDKLMDTVLLTDEDTQAFYDQTKQEYVDWLKELANKYNINIYEEVSEQIKHYREVKEQISAKIKEEKRQERAENKKNIALQKIAEDGSYIQQDLDRAADLIEQQIKGARLGYLSLKGFREILKNFGGQVYYIGACSNTAVRYVTPTYELSADIKKAKLFKNKEDAKSFLEVLPEKPEYSDMHLLTVKLITNNGSVETVLQSGYKINAIKRLSSIFEILDDPEDVQLVIRVIQETFGIDSKEYSGECGIYLCKDDVSRVMCSENNKAIPGNIGKNIVVKKLDGQLPKAIKSNNVVYTLETLKFSSDWYKDKVTKMAQENAIVQALLVNEDAITQSYKFGIDRYTAANRYKSHAINRLRSRLKNSGRTEPVYYIATMTDYMHGSIDNIVYARLHNTNNLTKTLTEMDLFNNYNEALKACRVLYNNYRTSRIYNIMQLDCAYLE